jgi:D-glycero-alpha-D-manno-heptose 1-phosphate guanylyltransferase
MIQFCFKVISALLLAGGQGTRLRSLYPDLPKPMVPVAGRPFLEWMLQYLAGQGIGRAVISTGHLAEVIEDHFRQHPALIPVECVRESTPLGTGGAVRFALGQTSLSDPFLVLNADSLVMADLAPALAAFERTEVDGVVLGVEINDASRYGTLDIGEGGWLLGFHEKRPGAGAINAGVYVFRQRLMRVFDRWAEGTAVSMENDVFPAMLESGARILTTLCRADFLDIGTPESFELADGFIQRNFAPLTMR